MRTKIDEPEFQVWEDLYGCWHWQLALQTPTSEIFLMKSTRNHRSRDACDREIALLKSVSAAPVRYL
jgi:hypothetical protein